MKTRQTGFTLMELIIVIIIMGILAATAMPKFVDFSGDAEQASVNAVAGAITDATTLNFAKKKLGTGGVDIKGNDVCDDTAGTSSDAVIDHKNDLLTGSVSLVTTAPGSTSDFKISGTANCTGAGVVVDCTIESKSGKTATAKVTCTG